jgi:nucleoside-diphosphate-sugar epimerase
LAGEHYARIFYSLHGLETVCLRYFNVYGPRQNPHAEYAAVVPKFLSRLVAGQPPTIFGDGNQTRDFCFVGDVVQANLLAAETTNAEAIGAVFNIASGTRTSLNELFALMREVMGATVSAGYEAARLGDVRHSGADIRRANAVLGYAPGVTTADALTETMRYYRVQATIDRETKDTRKVAGNYVSDLWHLNANVRK